VDELADSVTSLKYLVARPGTFTAFYPETTDDMLLQVLIDGMAEAHLEGLLLTYDSDEDGLLDPALTSGQAALVVLFSAVRFLRAELLNRSTSVDYKAGTANYSATQATNILRDILKGLVAQRDATIRLMGSAGGAGAVFAMADQYLARAFFDNGNFSQQLAYPLTGW
jgi:hypothetical protein